MVYSDSIHNNVMDNYIIIVLLVTLSICVVPSQAGETCTYYSSSRGQTVTEYCDGYCCDTTSDHCCSDYGMIIGLVIGGIVVVGIIGALVCILYQKKKKKNRRTIQVTRVTATNVHSHHNNRSRVRTVGNGGMVAPPAYSLIDNSSYQPYSDPSYPPPPPYPGTPAPPYQPMGYAHPGMDGPMPSHPTNSNGGQLQSSGLQNNQTDFSAYPPPPVS